MKKILLLFALVLSLTSLSAGEVWVSNGLGQKRSLKDNLEGFGWELQVEGLQATLCLNGQMVWRRTDRGDGYDVEYPDHMHSVYLDEDGKVVREKEGNTETNYFYEGRLLSSVNYSQEGEVVRRIEYLRSSDGILLAYRDGDMDAYVTGSVLVYSSAEGYVVYGEEFSLEKSVTNNPDGGYTEDDGTTRKTYSGEGRLLVEEHVDYTLEYLYSEEGALLETNRLEDGLRLQTLYAEGKALEAIQYGADGTKTSSSRVLEDGTIEEIRYIGGEPRYRFHFDRDGRRVLEATAL